MYSNIPYQLKDLNDFLCYDDRDKDYFKDLSDTEIQQEKKRPRDLKGKPLNNWLKQGYTFNECIDSIKNGFNSGIGIVLKNNGIVILDYDKVVKDIEVNDDLGYIKPIFKDKETEQRVLKDINLLQSYTELSPSNKGLHIVCLSDIKDLYITSPIEIYSKNKFIRFSGNDVFNFNLNYCNNELLEIIDNYKIDKSDAKQLKFNQSILNDFLSKNFNYTNGYTDKQIIDTMFNNKNNGSFIKDLFNNTLSDDEYIQIKSKKLQEQLKKGIISQDFYNSAINKIDASNSGKAYTLILYLFDACYGDIKAVNRIFKKSKLCKDEYLKPKYKNDKLYKMDKIDYMIKKAITGAVDNRGNIINQYVNYRFKN